MRTFKKFDKQFPLRRFQASIMDPQTGRPLSNARGYTSAIRQLFGALGVTNENQAWRDIEKVREFYDSLKSPTMRRLLVYGWPHWLRYAGMEGALPLLGRSRVSGIAAALRALVKPFSGSVSEARRLGGIPTMMTPDGRIVPRPAADLRRYCAIDLRTFHWRRDPTGNWIVVDSKGQRVGWTAPKYVPALYTVRMWGYPPPEEPLPDDRMAVFLPVGPGCGSAPMNQQALYMQLRAAPTGHDKRLERDCLLCEYLTSRGVPSELLEDTYVRVAEVLNWPESTTWTEEARRWAHDFTNWQEERKGNVVRLVQDEEG